MSKAFWVGAMSLNYFDNADILKVYDDHFCVYSELYDDMFFFCFCGADNSIGRLNKNIHEYPDQHIYF